jgi:hypothetical protein
LANVARRGGGRLQHPSQQRLGRSDGQRVLLVIAGKPRRRARASLTICNARDLSHPLNRKKQNAEGQGQDS